MVVDKGIQVRDRGGLPKGRQEEYCRNGGASRTGILGKKPIL